MGEKILYIHNADFSISQGNKSQVVSMCNAFHENEVDLTLLGFKCSNFDFDEIYGTVSPFKKILINVNKNYYIRSLILFFKFIKISSQFKNIFARDLFVSYLIKFFFNSKNVIYELHDYNTSKIWKYLFNISFKKIDKIIVISNGLAEKLFEEGYDRNKIVVLQDGVDLKKFDINISKLEARKKLNLPKKNIIISYVGNTNKHRDLKTLFSAIKNFDNCLVVIYGTKKDYLKKYDNKIFENVIFKGYTQNPEIVYKASDLLFAGFTNEVKTINYMSPLKLFEYMSSKVPIIVSDFIRVREILKDGDAFFYESKNINDLKNKINKFLNDSDLSNSMAKNSYSKVKKFTWNKRAKKIIQQYKK
jgi:glycosyltransferase involved in cell wall biosynthesis